MNLNVRKQHTCKKKIQFLKKCLANREPASLIKQLKLRKADVIII